MDKTVKLKHRSAYGKDFYDPLDETGKLILELTGTKTLTKDQVKVLQKLGYEVSFVVPGFED